MSLTLGIKGRADGVVTPDKTAAAMGSGLVPVFATPCMVALMEGAAVSALAPYLAEGEGSVGVHLDVSHDAATPVGFSVWAECTLTAIDGKLLTFTVSAYDEAGLIGAGTHRRCIIQTERFLAKAERKKEAAQNGH